MRRFLFHNFRLIFAIDIWVRQRFTLAGKLVLGGLVAASVFGVDTRQTFAYQLFSLLLALLLLAILGSWFSRLKLTAQRELPRFLTVGEPFDYRVLLTNHTSSLQQGLLLSEQIKQNPPTFAQFSQIREKNQWRQNWFDNYVGYPRWLWLISLNRGANVEPKLLPPLPPKGTLAVSLRILPLRRGFIHFDRLKLARTDPLGLFNALHFFSLPERLLVLPYRYPIPPLNFSGSRKYQKGGVNLAMSVGDAEEFMSLREYRPGDPLRHIHWRSFARLGKPVVKEYQDEFFVRHALILDTFNDYYYEPRFEQAVSIAASFACAPRSHEILLDLMFVGSEAHCFTSGRGLAPVSKLLEILACVEMSKEPNLEHLYPLLNQHLHSLSACICVLLNWDEQRRSFIQWLRAKNIQFLAVILSQDPESDADAQSVGVKVLNSEQLASELAALTV
ncbi:DUF58 domain-containing protein [Thioflexithrix psekupsensis]|uniref:DUF58 domain-containing protein n=1 Tax=Thioflexithrix psekupsensis TaxID=1570016 RepID=A0A251X6T1_9GAMM|nr:DUF58 domain-containing protein [Thioflexithrix psekupsensis]OUD12637.1 hypothetical protein TPSD3_16300 [Thioflexithrix psekupsensis]